MKVELLFSSLFGKHCQLAAVLYVSPTILIEPKLHKYKWSLSTKLWLKLP